MLALTQETIVCVGVIGIFVQFQDITVSFGWAVRHEGDRWEERWRVAGTYYVRLAVFITRIPACQSSR